MAFVAANYFQNTSAHVPPHDGTRISLTVRIYSEMTHICGVRRAFETPHCKLASQGPTCRFIVTGRRTRMSRLSAKGAKSLPDRIHVGVNRRAGALGPNHALAHNHRVDRVRQCCGFSNAGPGSERRHHRRWFDRSIVRRVLD